MVKPRIIGEINDKTQEEKPKKKTFLSYVLTIIAIVFILAGTCGINIELASRESSKFHFLATPLMLFWPFLIFILAKLGAMDTKGSRITLAILFIIVCLLVSSM